MAFPIIGKTVTCSRCGETVERAARCSNCGVKVKNPLIPFILFLALLGCIVFVSRAVGQREPRLIKVSEIKPYMNFRKARVEGRLIEPARELKSGALFYLVHDGSGQLPVFAPASANPSLPWKGARVSASGSLRVGVGNNRSLQATSVEVVEGNMPEIEEGVGIRLTQVTAGREGETILVSGVVSKLWKPKPGSKAPHKIILEDPSGRIEIVHWLETPPEIELGEPLEVTGIVQVYKGRVELKVLENDWIQRPNEPEAEPKEVKIGEITAMMEKQVVITEGVLGAPRSIPGGVIYPMSDDSGTVQLLFWDNQVSGEERDSVDEGMHLRVEAPVVNYKGMLELVPKDVGSFQILD